MDVKEIPQDNSASYQGHLKVVYATRNGRYESHTSSGWADEAYATEQAGEVLHHLAKQAWEQMASGEKSPLYYWMYAYRHDERSLAMAAGVFRWQLRRHFRPQVFARLSDAALRRYAEVFHISVQQLRQPDAAAAHFAPERQA